MAKRIAPDVASRRNWSRFMKKIQTPVPGLSVEAAWPFQSLTPEEWGAIPQHVQRRLDNIIAEYARMAGEAHG